MSGYALTPLAKAGIFDIWAYMAEDSEAAADRVEQAIFDACAFVAEAPTRGHTRPDLTTRPLRLWTPRMDTNKHSGSATNAATHEAVHNGVVGIAGEC
jgi:plasmid stabilization system protein ParE